MTTCQEMLVDHAFSGADGPAVAGNGAADEPGPCARCLYA